jgi:hypothetical protein
MKLFLKKFLINVNSNKCSRTNPNEENNCINLFIVIVCVSSFGANSFHP